MRGCSERSARRSEAGSGLRQGGNAYGSWRGAPKERKGDGLVRSSLGRAAATALVLAAGAAIAGTSTAAERVALVIGNGAYQHTVPLRNPRNDAGAVARQLRNLGFEVIEGLDLDEAAFEARLREFSRAAANAETTLFFYAGHGLQVDGQNYLVPVDAELAEEVDLRWDAVPLGNVIAEMRSEVNLVFLDACRDNPLARNLAGSMGSSRSAAVGRGLGRVESVSGTLIAYATQPGNVADDGDGENSPFTAALVANLAAPGLSVNDLMTSVTDAVATRTNGRQQPWTHSSLRKPFYFNPVDAPQAAQSAAVGAAMDAVPAASGAVPGTLALEETARAAYEAAERLHVVEGYEAVVKRFDGSIYADLARAQIGKLREGTQPQEPASLAAAPATAPEAASSAVPASPGPDALELALGLERPERRRIQSGLASLGFDPGPVDGLFGRGTRGAIGRLQASFGLEATGFLDAEIAKDLLAAGDTADDAAFARARAAGTPEAYAAYLGSHPAGRHAAEARLLLAEAEESERLRPGSVFRDCSDCPEMVVVPAGSFGMGSPPGEENRYDNEGPVHRVEIRKPFAVGKYEVTFAEWDACVSAGDCGGYRPGDRGWGRGRRPVVNVNWEDAKSYVSWLSRKSGEAYRLLSESEWEYAARAGTTGPFHFGSTISTDQANYDGALAYGSGGKGVYRGKTVLAGSFPANGFNLHDMHGNVWEWVEDCWNDSYAGAPSDGSVWTSGDCSARVLRGGSWIFEPRFVRSAYRGWSSTGSRYGNFGFRVARILD